MSDQPPSTQTSTDVENSVKSDQSGDHHGNMITTSTTTTTGSQTSPHTQTVGVGTSTSNALNSDSGMYSDIEYSLGEGKEDNSSENSTNETQTLTAASSVADNGVPTASAVKHTESQREPSYVRIFVPVTLSVGIVFMLAALLTMCVKRRKLQKLSREVPYRRVPEENPPW